MAKKLLIISILFVISVSILINRLLNSNSVLSVIVQTFIYLVRPHTNIPTKYDLPLKNPSIWLGKDLINNEKEWRIELNQNQIIDLKNMVNNTKQYKMNETSLLLKEHCILGKHISSSINKWINATIPGKGLGFIVIRGFPIDDWNEKESEIAFWCIGKHLGRAGAQNSKVK